jgi:hypothetical protein
VIKIKVAIRKLETNVHLVDLRLVSDDIKKSRLAPNREIIIAATIVNSPKFMILALAL